MAYGFSGQCCLSVLFLLAEELSCSFQSNVDVRADMVAVHDVIEATLLQLLVNLLVYTREDDVDAICVVHLNECLQVVDTRRIYKRYATHAYDAHVWA